MTHIHVRPSHLALALGCIAAASVAIAQKNKPPLAQKNKPYPMGERIGSHVVDRLSPSEIRGMINYVADDSRGVILPISQDGRAQYIVNVRREDSDPERHAEWDDVMVIQSGNGFLEYSESIKGGKRYGAGEWRGGKLVGDLTSVDLAPGVVVRVPAGVPHVVRPLGDAPLVYLVLKEKAAIQPVARPASAR